MTRIIVIKPNGEAIVTSDVRAARVAALDAMQAAFRVTLPKPITEHRRTL